MIPAFYMACRMSYPPFFSPHTNRPEEVSPCFECIPQLGIELRSNVLSRTTPWAAYDGHHSCREQHAEEAVYHRCNCCLDGAVLRCRVIKLEVGRREAEGEEARLQADKLAVLVVDAGDASGSAASNEACEQGASVRVGGAARCNWNCQTP